ncbi:MAG: response regulator [Flavobacterium sp.]|nr:response regulator [Flavobacterium sp.]
MATNITTAFETVMIIDDNPIDLYIASSIIKNNNFGKNILLYQSASEALKYLKDNQENIPALPQIIFVDIYMPLMSGFEFLENYEVMSDSIKVNCCAYIISSTIDDFDIARARNEKNASSFQVKPITKKFLDRIIAEKTIS